MEVDELLILLIVTFILIGLCCITVGYALLLFYMVIFGIVVLVFGGIFVVVFVLKKLFL